MLKGRQKTARLTSANGKAYAEDTFRTFFTTDSEQKRFFEGSDGNARANTTRFGIYYYENNIRDLTSDGFYVDKKLHAYADRMYLQLRLLSDKPTETLSSFGLEIKLPALKVAAAKVSVNGKEREIPMTMKDWADHLEGILTYKGEQLLVGAGSVSHDKAMLKAETEYKKYKARTISDAERDYLDAVKELKKMK